MRLIDADALLARVMMDAPSYLDGGSAITKAFIMAMIRTKSVTPTIDAVQVVRCKDCKKGYIVQPGGMEPYVMCGGSKNRPLNWYCADGEKEVDQI